jgi:DNA polymerase
VLYIKISSPLLDKKCKADVFWVGLSAKKVEDIENDIPLSNDTNSCKIINRIESRFDEEIFYRTNLVKCVPLDWQGKLRYPVHHPHLFIFIFTEERG